jgi:peptide/nickel transport system substrate-binding protein
MPAHYLKQYHGDYADAAALERMADDAGLDTWMQLFRAKADYVNPESPSMSAWVIVDDSPGAVVYERNPYYWKVDPEGNQLPYIERISISCGESAEAMDFKVIAGEIDFRHGSNFNKFSLFQKSAENGNYHSIAPLTALTNQITANRDHESDPEIRDLLRNQNFRITISLSIDKQEILDTFYFGMGRLANISFMRNSPFYDAVESYRLLYTVQDLDIQ